MRELKIENKMRVPRLSKIVINMGLGEARDNIKLLEAAAEELTVIAGQKPIMTKARKAISNFKLRENVPIGVMVTLAARADVGIFRSPGERRAAAGARLPRHQREII